MAETTRFRKGDRVEWSSHGGEKTEAGVATGTVVVRAPIRAAPKAYWLKVGCAQTMSSPASKYASASILMTPSEPLPTMKCRSGKPKRALSAATRRPAPPSG